MFAKIYETDIGQILVKMDVNDEYKPEVRFYFKPDNLGVCSHALGFNDDDEGWDKAEKAFERADEKMAREFVGTALSMIEDMELVSEDHG